MVDYRKQVQEKLQKITSGISYTDEQIGVLGRLASDGSADPNPSADLDMPYVWVRLNDTDQAIRMINQTVTSRIPNLRVRVALDRKMKEWVVLGLAPEIIHQFPEQAPTWNQPDRISDLILELVDLNRVRGLRVKRGTSALTVVLESGYYYWQGEFRAWLETYDELDISGDVPGGYGTKRPVLIGIDPATDTLTSYAGDPVLVTIPPTKQKMLTPDLIEAAVQAAPSGIRWVACIPLTSTDTDWSDPQRVTALQYVPIFGAGQYDLIRVDDVDQTPRGAVNFISGTGINITGTDDAGNNETEIQVEADPEAILDGKLLMSAADTERDYLQDKLTSSSPELTYNPQTLGGGYQILNLELDQALIDHTNLLNRGTNTHATIDTHLASTSNPHNTTLEQARTANSTLSGKVIFAAPGTSDPSLRIPTGAAPSSLTAGDLWHDITQLTLMAYLAGIKQGLSGVIFTQTATVTVSNTGAETTLVGSGIGTMTLPANFLKVGKTLHIKAGGFYGTDAVAPDNVIRIKLGSTTILATSADVLTAGIGNNRGWTLDAFITCRSVGATGTVIGQGMLMYSTGGVSTRNYPMQNLATVTVDTTASLALNLTCDFNNADPDNIMNCTNLSVAIYN